MKNYEATERAFKNGYEKGYEDGKRDAVKHGRWEGTLVPDGYVQKASRMRKKCSVCGWTNACRYNYCPNCGAKMDGQEKDGNLLFADMEEIIDA